MTTQDKDMSKPARPLLILLPVLILAVLLLAPPLRPLLKTQCRLLFDSRAFADRLRDMGVKTGPIPTEKKWEQSASAKLVAEHPQDYTLQVAGALLTGTSRLARFGSMPQQRFAAFQYEYGDSLTALSLRFPNRPGLYAHYLRYMTSLSIRLSREATATKFQTGPHRYPDLSSGCAESWAAYDNAAALGEKADPDNAYFPLMRAIGLFDAKRDTEGVAAVLRAGQKSRYEDYCLEEPEAEWTLYRRTYRVESALLRASYYSALVYPHVSQLRTVGRVAAVKAAQAEQEGRTQEGLALRHAMMQTAVRIREQGNPITALVGVAIFSANMHSSGGVLEAPLAQDATEAQRYTAPCEAYLAYLHGLGQPGEAAWVEREAATNKEVRDLIRNSYQHDGPYDPLVALPGLWIADMLLLASLLGILGMCGMGVLLGRPNLRGGEKLMPWAALGVLVCCMLVAFPMQWAESLTQMRMALSNLSASNASKSDPTDLGVRMSEVITNYPGVVHVGEVVLSLAAPVLVLMVAGVVGLCRKEPFSTALLRSLQRGALIFAAILAIGYALALFSTARVEAQANGVLDSTMKSEMASLRQQVGNARKPR